MKARIPNQNLFVLFYHLEASKQQAFCAFLDSLSIPYREILPAQLNQTLGQLAFQSDSSLPPYEGPIPDREFMVMCGFNHSQVNSFLDRMRKSGVPTIELKAVLTAQNQQWTILNLLQELAQEHEIMKVYSRLMPAIQEAESIPEENHDPVLWNTLNQAIFAARQAVSQEEPSAEGLSQALENLLAARNALR